MLDDLLAILLVLALCGGTTTAVFEAYRLAREPYRRQPLAAEESERDPFHNAIAVLIATVSICGALLAWRGSGVYGAAEGRNHDANQALVRDNEVSAIADSSLEFGALQTLQLEDHIVQARTLAERADALRNGPDATTSAALAAALDAQAAEERGVARVVASGFLGIFSPRFADDGSGVVYDADQVRATYRALNQDYRTLDAVQVAAQADAVRLHHTARLLVRIGILLTVALFLLTVANLVALHRRLWVFVPAVASIGIGLVMFVVVRHLP